MRLMVAAFIWNVDLDKIAGDLVILDKRMKPEEIAAQLNKLAEDGPFSLVIGDTLQALFDGDDSNSNPQTGEFIRRWRAMTQLKGNPAVIIAAHPVKNAASDNLVPYGGGAVLNEVDGNLTLSLSPGGVTELHWQGKLRGVDFEPVQFRFETLSSPDVLDVKGRQVPLPVLRPTTAEEAECREEAAIDRREALLAAMLDSPGAVIRDWATSSNIPKSAVERLLSGFERSKLAEKIAGRWTLTTKGRKACPTAKHIMGQEKS